MARPGTVEKIFLIADHLLPSEIFETFFPFLTDGLDWGMEQLYLNVAGTGRLIIWRTRQSYIVSRRRINCFELIS